MIKPIGDFFSTDCPSSCLESHASTIGMANASVFPDPVEALPITSRPAIIFRIAAACMSVGFVNLSRARQAVICGDSSRGAQSDMSTSSPASSTAASPADANTLLSSSWSSSVCVVALFFLFFCFFLSFCVCCVSFVASFLVSLLVGAVASGPERDGSSFPSCVSCVGISAGSSPKPSNSSPSSSLGAGPSSVVTWFDISAQVD